MIDAPPGSLVRFHGADTARESRVAIVTPDGREHLLIYVKSIDIRCDANHGVRARVELLEREGVVLQLDPPLASITPVAGAIDVPIELVDFVDRKWWGAVPA